jgi:uncharacterized protein
MKISSRAKAAALVCLALGSLFASAQGGAFLDGRWEGSIDLGGGAEELALSLFAPEPGLGPEPGLEAGGLLDLPARGIFGYPMDALERDAEGLSFSLLGGAPFDGRFELKGVPEPIGPGQSFSVSGLARLVPAKPEIAGLQGPFTLAYKGTDSRGRELGADYRIDTGGGVLPGSLLIPGEADYGPVPIALLLSSAGTDRDGNNYSVPGRSDALAQLALALRDRGIASLRFDRRGTGEAYRLESKEEPSVELHAADARAALAGLERDPRFAGIAIVGYGEGTLVGSLALRPSGDETLAAEPLLPEAALPGLVPDSDSRPVVGIVSLCASGRTELEMVEEALSSTPADLKAEAEAIMTSLKGGGLYPDPSPYFADYFKPSAQSYLSSLFRNDIRESFAALRYPALVIAGGSDLQVGLSESELLARARPDAAYRVIPGMSHALKSVGADEKANYASFTDPAIPLAAGLADLIAAFARGEDLPDEEGNRDLAGP